MMFDNISIVVLVLSYIVLTKWVLSLPIVHVLGVDEHTADCISYAIIVVLTPITMYHYFHYETTPLVISVFVGYSVFWLLKRIYQRAYLKF